MGVLKVVRKTTAVAAKGAQAVTAKKAECEGCGKTLRSTKKTICSTTCAQFVVMSY